MCGIAGLLRLDGTVERAELERMADFLRHRGPDHTGIHHEPHLGLVSTRLSIQDLSHAADMPMWSSDGRLAIVYNGEVYNFRELRDELRARGHAFRTTGDTEVVLHAWREWGAACLRRFNGMFAFAILDRERRTLVLARDQFGKKTVYYHLSGRSLAFASEVKAIWALDGVTLTLDDRAVLEYLATDHALGTMFRELRAVEPGEFVEFDIDMAREVRRGRYRRLQDWIDADLFRQMKSAPSGAVERAVDERLSRAVAIRLIADAPVGVMCSGGVDSSLVTLHASRHTEQLEVFTVDIPGHPVYSEAQYAAEVCRKVGARHHIYSLGREEYLREVVDNIYFNDIPPAHLGSSIGVYAVCRLAREAGIKVLLSGEGADETFCGYHPRYRTNYLRTQVLGLARPWRWLPASLRELLSDASIFEANLLKGIEARDLAIVVARATGSRVLYEELCARYREFAGRDAEIMAMALLDLSLWIQSILLRTDRASMQASIEARIPFLDDDLTRLALNLPLRWRVTATQDKVVLKRLLSKEMGSAFARRPKVGFGVLPYIREINLPRLFSGGFVLEYFGEGIVRLGAERPELLAKLAVLEIWHRLFGARMTRDEVRSLCVADERSPAVRPASAGRSGVGMSRADEEALTVFVSAGETPAEGGILRRGDATHFAATIASSLIGLVSSVIAAKFLQPGELGTIQSVMLLASYLAFMDFGVCSGLFRNVPLALGRGDAAWARRMVDTAWSVVRAVAALGVGISAGVMVWGWVGRGDPLFGWAALGLMSQLAFAPVENFFVILYRSVQEFHVLGKRLNWKNMFMALSLGLPAVAGAAGLIARNVLLPVVGVFLLGPGLPLRPVGRGSWRDAVSLASVGLPILVVNLLTSFLMAADRSVIALRLGAEAVGHYALASLVLVGFPVLPAALGAILYPRAAHEFGRFGSSRGLFGFLWKSIVFNVAVLVPSCALAYWALPPLVNAFLPAYASGIRTAQLACLSCLFLLYVGPANILVVVRRNFQYGLLLALATAAVWVVGWLLAGRGWGIEGVAVARLLANILLCFSVIAYTAYVVWKNIPCED